MTVTFLRHFKTEIDPEEPQSEWNLSDKGKEQQKDFIQSNEFDYDIIYSSPEKKALETARKISDEADIPLVVSSDLKEVDRSREGFIEDHEKYIDMVERYLEKEEIGFDWENFEEAEKRILSFSNTVDPEKDILAVTHGMLISTFMPELFEQDRFDFWQSLGFGDTFEVNTSDIQEVVK